MAAHRWGRTLGQVECDLILDTLKYCLGNRTHAANTIGLSERSEQEPKCEIILGVVYLAGRSRLAGEPQATLTALSSPTSGSEGNLRTHRECVELGAGISGVGRADLLGNVAV